MTLSKRSYYPALDGIRALAFLLVFAAHYLVLPWGWVGVDVFFVLSGFLITGILLDTRDQPDRARNFYIRRALRIFPLYFGVMLLLIVMWPLFHWEWNWHWLVWPLFLGNFAPYAHAAAAGSPQQLLGAAQLRSGAHPRVMLFLGHFWSLCVEEQFYLVWPWLVFWIRSRRTLLLLCASFIIGCPLLRLFANHHLPEWMLRTEVLYRATPFRVDALLLGAIVTLALRSSAARFLPMLARVVFTILAALSGIQLWRISRIPHTRLVYPYPSWTFTWGLATADLLSACLIILALDPDSLVYRLFDVAPLRSLGRVSYGAYVFHDIFHPVLILIAFHFTSRWLLGSTLLALPLTFALAYISYYLFESRFILLKDRLAPSKPAAMPVQHQCTNSRETAPA